MQLYDENGQYKLKEIVIDASMVTITFACSKCYADSPQGITLKDAQEKARWQGWFVDIRDKNNLCPDCCKSDWWKNAK